MATDLVNELESRFFPENLLNSEAWDACLYDCETMEEMDDSTDLFRCFDNVTEFNTSLDLDLDLNLNMDIETSDLPWSQINGDIYSDLRVKLEPLSPGSSRCSDSSLASSCDMPLFPQPHQTVNTEPTLPVVKTEDPPTPPCVFGDVLNPPLNTVQLSVVKKENGTSPVKQGPAIQTTAKANSIMCNKPNIQPKPVVVTTLTTAPTTSPAKTIILQSVQTSLPVSQQQSLPLKQTIPAPASVTLDPNTANPWLVLSEDRTSVRLGGIRKQLPDSPTRFDQYACVLGAEGFTSGKHYWEVRVGNKTEWRLGVAQESINRKGEFNLRSDSGCWLVWLKPRKGYVAGTSPSETSLTTIVKPRNIGVYLDYEGGQVSFYNADTMSPLHTFTHTFTERVFPIFFPGLNVDCKNAAPLIICGVRDH
ncbi:E3 ubiquitin-protein ligase TRIM58-like [Rhincodon typus]|uniref:E3 ubiquitin-protein ligase TRIM58-like n=1 Tax=Rhincodon typus TaxID=259920 RepID=UPI002030DEB6|nr:E3 ubiquitin-protein ligase TRIM58-like [Rhincodon typus]